MNAAFDPVLTLLPSAFFALLFGIAATHKLMAWRLFQQQVADYRVLPRFWTRPAAVAIPIVEVLVTLGWLAAATRPYAAGLSAVLLAAYAAAMEWNLAEGRDAIDCGCGGIDGSQVIRPALVVRNLVLCVIATALALSTAFVPETGRVPGWIDWLTVFAGALVLQGMYVTTNQILANLPPQRILD